MNQLKTVLLLGTLTGLFLFVGYLIGGQTGMVIAFLFSCAMNLYSYYYSDQLVLKAYNATPLDPSSHRDIYKMVEELAHEYKIPTPKIWYVDTEVANAFATGRNPEHGQVAVTRGILEILNPRELRGVLAHELGHIKNRDILVSTIAVTLAGAIGVLANFAKMSLYMGGGSREDEGSNRSGILGVIVLAIVMPVLASLIHLGVSRSREYLADESGAEHDKDPLALASALKKLEQSVKKVSLKPENSTQQAAGSLFIVYPFSSETLTNLFSTHPPMEKRIARLEAMARKMGKT